MEAVREEFIPRGNTEKEEMKNFQRKIARKAEFKDKIDFDIDRIDQKIVVGVDQAFTEDKSVSCVIAMEEGEIIEEVSASTDINMPYIPGLLAFREGEAIVKALKELETEPDLLIFDGSGRIHFRQAGIATHIGVIFDKPAIGVAKNLLCGQPETETDKLSEGEKVAIKTGPRVENMETGVIGYAYQSRQYENSTKINPLYISPGNKVSNKTAVKIVEKLCEGYKLPEPTRIADKRAAELKKKYQ